MCVCVCLELSDFCVIICASSLVSTVFQPKHVLYSVDILTKTDALMSFSESIF